MWLQLKEQGPPDLEEIFKKFFSGNKDKGKKNPFDYSERQNRSGDDGSSGKGGDSSSGSPGMPTGKFFLSLVALVIVFIVLWAVFGFFKVNPGEKAVILRFGKYSRTLGPGLQWKANFMETKYVLDTQKQNEFKWPLQPMLTEPTHSKQSGGQQSQLVDVEFNVFWKISNLKNFLFSVDNPVASLKESTDSAIRQVIGQTSFNQIISTNRGDVQEQIEKELVKLMSRYKTGIEIMSVSMLQAIPPQPVREAFQDLVNAPQDQETTINRAEIYKSNLLPVANGQAKRVVIEAEAKKENLILTSRAQVAPYKAILKMYNLAPKVTGDRLYFDALQNVLGNSNIMVVDHGKSGGNNVFYLPMNPNQNIQYKAPVPSSSSPNSVSGVSSSKVAAGSGNNQNLDNGAYSRWEVANT